MPTYYIYHIPGIKFGCTINLKRRKAQYPEEIRGLVELYETLLDSTPLEASEREKTLNIHFGYVKGTPYTAAAASAIRRREKRNKLIKPVLWRSRMVQDECPYCGLKSNRAILKRWHFGKCPRKPEGL